MVRSSGSIGANYIEANESSYWLRLLWDMNDSHRKKINELKDEALEIKKILSAIINKS